MPLILLRALVGVTSSSMDAVVHANEISPFSSAAIKQGIEARAGEAPSREEADGTGREEGVER